MNFNDFDRINRAFEYEGNRPIPPDSYIIVRLDGHGFSKFTKQNFAKPFDQAFRDLMIDTTEYLYETSGYDIAYAYTQSDEISLLLKKDDNTFNRRPKKFSLLAGAASAYFSLEFNRRFKSQGVVATFDVTVDIRPNIYRVLDYFVWRQEDSARNCLNGYAYWTLINNDKVSPRKAGHIIENQGNSFKQELLFERGINFDKIPAWQKRGIGFYRVEVPHRGFNPITNEEVMTTRKVIEKNYELPMKDEYREFLTPFIV